MGGESVKHVSPHHAFPFLGGEAVLSRTVVYRRHREGLGLECFLPQGNLGYLYLHGQTQLRFSSKCVSNTPQNIYMPIQGGGDAESSDSDLPLNAESPPDRRPQSEAV